MRSSANMRDDLQPICERQTVAHRRRSGRRCGTTTQVRLTRERLDGLTSHGAVTGKMVNMRYLVIGLLITLAACEPYRGSVSATPRWSENCGTPDAPKRCPSVSRPPPAQVSAPLPDYN